MKMKTITSLFAACFALGVVAADAAEISRVSVRQRWPWSRLVDIDYVLACDSTQRLDIAVSAYNGSDPLDVPASSFSGDLYGLSYGAHHIVWDPTVTSCTNTGVLPEFRVALTMTNSPVYMIVDLTKTAGSDGQIEYIYPGDARLETYGRFTNVWFGVTNDSVYATDKLVLRRVHAGTFGMGDSANIQITLTKDFYVGVFEVTQAQWFKVMNTDPSDFKNLAGPVNKVSYYDIRENWTPSGGSAISPNWPASCSVGTNSFMGKLRASTGIGGFDLPTEAQWEYVCRAGTSSYYSDGVSVSSTETNILNELAWWGGSSYNGNSSNTTHTSGQKTSNAWGLYDIHGNVFEWCLDFAHGTLVPAVDPVGPTTSTDSWRCTRSGGYNYPTKDCGSATRNRCNPNGLYNMLGFRLVMTLP